ncbi:unnamed protein product [Amoebophrya sp. A120]|nr:unnamed protein product [Amoebophrya sp. A120]|eukprot:GSA120T00013210001.1
MAALAAQQQQQVVQPFVYAQASAQQQAYDSALQQQQQQQTQAAPQHQVQQQAQQQQIYAQQQQPFDQQMQMQQQEHQLRASMHGQAHHPAQGGSQPPQFVQSLYAQQGEQAAYQPQKVVAAQQEIPVSQQPAQLQQQLPAGGQPRQELQGTSTTSSQMSQPLQLPQQGGLGQASQQPQYQQGVYMSPAHQGHQQQMVSPGPGTTQQGIQQQGMAQQQQAQQPGVMSPGPPVQQQASSAQQKLEVLTAQQQQQQPAAPQHDPVQLQAQQRQYLQQQEQQAAGILSPGPPTASPVQPQSEQMMQQLSQKQVSQQQQPQPAPQPTQVQQSQQQQAQVYQQQYHQPPQQQQAAAYNQQQQQSQQQQPSPAPAAQQQQQFASSPAVVPVQQLQATHSYHSTETMSPAHDHSFSEVLPQQGSVDVVQQQQQQQEQQPLSRQHASSQMSVGSNAQEQATSRLTQQSTSAPQIQQQPGTGGHAVVADSTSTSTSAAPAPEIRVSPPSPTTGAGPIGGTSAPGAAAAGMSQQEQQQQQIPGLPGGPPVQQATVSTSQNINQNNQNLNQAPQNLSVSLSNTFLASTSSLSSIASANSPQIILHGSSSSILGVGVQQQQQAQQQQVASQDHQQPTTGQAHGSIAGSTSSGVGAFGAVVSTSAVSSGTTAPGAPSPQQEQPFHQAASYPPNQQHQNLQSQIQHPSQLDPQTDNFTYPAVQQTQQALLPQQQQPQQPLPPQQATPATQPAVSSQQEQPLQQTVQQGGGQHQQQQFVEDQTAAPQQPQPRRPPPAFANRLSAVPEVETPCETPVPSSTLSGRDSAYTELAGVPNGQLQQPQGTTMMNSTTSSMIPHYAHDPSQTLDANLPSMTGSLQFSSSTSSIAEQHQTVAVPAPAQGQVQQHSTAGVGHQSSAPQEAPSFAQQQSGDAFSSGLIPAGAPQSGGASSSASVVPQQPNASSSGSILTTPPLSGTTTISCQVGGTASVPQSQQQPQSSSVQLSTSSADVQASSQPISATAGRAAQGTMLGQNVNNSQGSSLAVVQVPQPTSTFDQTPLSTPQVQAIEGTSNSNTLNNTTPLSATTISPMVPVDRTLSAQSGSSSRQGGTFTGVAGAQPPQQQQLQQQPGGPQPPQNISPAPMVTSSTTRATLNTGTPVGQSRPALVGSVVTGSTMEVVEQETTGSTPSLVPMATYHQQQQQQGTPQTPPVQPQQQHLQQGGAMQQHQQHDPAQVMQHSPVLQQQSVPFDSVPPRPLVAEVQQQMGVVAPPLQMTQTGSTAQFVPGPSEVQQHQQQSQRQHLQPAVPITAQQQPGAGSVHAADASAGPPPPQWQQQTANSAPPHSFINNVDAVPRQTSTSTPPKPPVPPIVQQKPMSIGGHQMQTQAGQQGTPKSATGTPPLPGQEPALSLLQRQAQLDQQRGQHTVFPHPFSTQPIVSTPPPRMDKISTTSPLPGQQQQQQGGSGDADAVPQPGVLAPGPQLLPTGTDSADRNLANHALRHQYASMSSVSSSSSIVGGGAASNRPSGVMDGNVVPVPAPTTGVDHSSANLVAGSTTHLNTANTNLYTFQPSFADRNLAEHLLTAGGGAAGSVPPDTINTMPLQRETSMTNRSNIPSQSNSASASAQASENEKNIENRMYLNKTSLQREKTSEEISGEMLSNMFESALRQHAQNGNSVYKNVTTTPPPAQSSSSSSTQGVLAVASGGGGATSSNGAGNNYNNLPSSSASGQNLNHQAAAAQGAATTTLQPGMLNQQPGAGHPQGSQTQMSAAISSSDFIFPDSPDFNTSSNNNTITAKGAATMPNSNTRKESLDDVFFNIPSAFSAPQQMVNKLQAPGQQLKPSSSSSDVEHLNLLEFDDTPRTSGVNNVTAVPPVPPPPPATAAGGVQQLQQPQIIPMPPSTATATTNNIKLPTIPNAQTSTNFLPMPAATSSQSTTATAGTALVTSAQQQALQMQMQLPPQSQSSDPNVCKVKEKLQSEKEERRKHQAQESQSNLDLLLKNADADLFGDLEPK